MTRTHDCTGEHKHYNLLTLHTCACGATFYLVGEALDALIKYHVKQLSDGGKDA